MMALKKKREKGFTLMELMVVIVIVAILAAVAVPLYINYVKDAQRTEAKGAIGAVITAQQAYFQANYGQSYAADLATLEAAGHLDITEAKANWDFTTTPDGANGFTVTAAGKAGGDAAGLNVTYTFTRVGGGTWSDEAPPAP